MRRSIITTAALMVLTICRAWSQQMDIAASANVELANGVAFYANGLTFKPTTTFNLSGISIVPKSTVTNSLGVTYISRAYDLGANLSGFSGEIQLAYLEAELNGLDENNLKLMVFDNNQWQMISGSTRDVNNNIVAATLSNATLREITSAVDAILPLKWGLLSVARQGMDVKLKWSTENEHNVSHFDVERRLNNEDWLVAIPKVPARNLFTKQEYQEMDYKGQFKTSYYRIKQVDLNGVSTYSNIAVLAGATPTDQLSIFPNPISNSFEIAEVDPQAIKQATLIDISGKSVKNWKTYERKYDVSTIPNGPYVLRILLADGITIHKKIVIQR